MESETKSQWRGWVFAPCLQISPLLLSTCWLIMDSSNLSSPLVSRWEYCHIRHIRLLISQSLSMGSPSGWLSLYWRLQFPLGDCCHNSLSSGFNNHSCFTPSCLEMVTVSVTCSGTSVSLVIFLNSALSIVSSLLKNLVRCHHPFPARAPTDKLTWVLDPDMFKDSDTSNFSVTWANKFFFS